MDAHVVVTSDAVGIGAGALLLNSPLLVQHPKRQLVVLSDTVRSPFAAGELNGHPAYPSGSQFLLAQRYKQRYEF